METSIVFNANENVTSAVGAMTASLTGFGAMGATLFTGMISGAVGITKALGGFSWELVQMGANAEALQGKFDIVFGGLAGTVTQQLVDFGQAAGRSKWELMQMAANLQDTLVPMGFARDEAANMSVTLTKLAVDLASFNDISDMEAYQRLQGAIIGNTENLLAFGVVANEATLKQYALNNELWNGEGVLDPLTKAQAIYGMVLSQTTDAQGDAILTAWQFNNTMKAIESVFTELRTEMGMRLIPEFNNFLGIFKSLIPGIQQFGAGFAGVIGNVMGLTYKFINGFVGSLMGMDFKQINEKSGEWGNGLITNFAKGMAEAAKYVIQVLQFIGDVITYWLVPHSPPNLLPDIDVWGERTMTEYIKGWGEADLGLFGSIASTVAEYIKQALPDETELDKLNINNAIMLSRQVVAQNIEAVNQYKDAYFEALSSNNNITQYLAKNIQDLSYYSNKMAEEYQNGTLGNIAPTLEWNEVVEQAISNISEAAGGLTPAYKEYLEVLFSSEYAAQQVALAQEELNQVTQHFSDLLAPLNAELTEINDAKQAIRDQQRLEQLQSVLSDETKTAQEKELAALEIRGMEIEKQIRSVEKEQELATSLAEEKLSAAEAQQKRFEDELKIKQQILSIGQEQNSLFQEQNDLVKSILEEMNKVGESVGKAAKGLGEAGDKLKEALGAAQDFGSAPKGVAVFQETFDQIDTIFEDLNVQSTQLGETWGKIAGSLGDTKAAQGIRFILDVVSDLKTGFDDLVRRAGIFRTLMGSESVLGDLQKVYESVKKIGGLFASGLFSSEGMQGITNVFIATELPKLEEALNNWLDDFARNFKASFGLDISAPIETLKELLGSLFDNALPAIQKFQSIFNTVKNVFNNFLENLQPKLDVISEKFATLTEKLGLNKWQLFNDFINLIGIVVGTVLTTAFLAFMAAIEAVANIVEGVIDIFTILLDNYTEQQVILQQITDSFWAFGEALLNLDFATAWDEFNKLLSGFGELISNNYEVIFDVGVEIVTTIADAIASAWWVVVDAISQAVFGFDSADVGKMWKLIFDDIMNKFNTFMSPFTANFETIKLKFTEVYNTAKTWLVDNFGWLWDEVKEGWDIFIQMLTDFGSWFIEKATEWYNKIVEFAGGFTEAEGTANTTFINIRAYAENFKIKFWEFVENIKGYWNSFKETFRSAYDDTIKPKIEELKTSIVEMWDVIKQKFYDIGMWITGIKDKFVEMVRVVLEKIQPLLDAIELLAGAGEGGNTGGGTNPHPSPRASDASGMSISQSMSDTLPTVKTAFSENDIKQLVKNERNQTWNITFNQQNVEKRNVLEDMQIVKTFMGS